MHKHVGQLVNMTKGMRGALWAIEEELTESGGVGMNADALALWHKIKQAHRELRLSLQLLHDELPDDDLQVPF